MKKTAKIFISLLSSVVLSVSSLPVCSIAEGNITGDINSDGIVNVDDADMILRYYSENCSGNITSFSDAEIENILKYGDIDGNGEINSGDATRIAIIGAKSIDVNEDGVLDIDDAMMLREFAINIDSYSETEIINMTKKTSSVKYSEYDNMKEKFIRYSSYLAETFTGLEMGDINGDGYINSSDATEVLAFYGREASGIEFDTTSDEYKLLQLLGDMTFDGVINASDASKILVIYTENSSGK